MDSNMLGVAYISDELSQEHFTEVAQTMEAIIDKYIELAQKEFDEYLESNGLENAMGMIMPKEPTK